MSTRKIQGYITEADRKRYVLSYARCQVALSGHPDVSFAEAVRYVEEDVSLFRELRAAYDVEPDEAVDFSLSDGAIVEVEEPQ